MARLIATLTGVLVLALLAGALSEASLAIGHQGAITNDILLRPAATRKSVPSPSVSVKPVVTSSPHPAVITTPSAAPLASSVPVGTTNAFVHMRATASTSSAILYNLNGGVEVTLLSGGNSTWQEVEYNGATGYIYKTYLNE
jgi:uncharacterized protein YgiM (DUF1202 family)